MRYTRNKHRLFWAEKQILQSVRCPSRSIRKLHVAGTPTPMPPDRRRYTNLIDWFSESKHCRGFAGCR